MSFKISSNTAVKKINIPSVKAGSSNANSLSVFSGFKNSEPVWAPMPNIIVDSITFDKNINIYSTGSIGIGDYTNLPNNSVILNGSGVPIGPTGPGFYVAPITSNTGPNFLYYDNITKEVTYNPVGLTTTITIVGGDSTTHIMTFENGLLISYVTF
jgi:hypothetical protein